MNNVSQMLERIRDLENLIGEAWHHPNGRILGDSWNARARAVVEKAEHEQGTYKRQAMHSISLNFTGRTGDGMGLGLDRENQIGMNLLNSFDRAGIGASLDHTGITITYEENEVSDWCNIYFDTPTTTAERIVQRWMHNSAKVGRPSRTF